MQLDMSVSLVPEVGVARYGSVGVTVDQPATCSVKTTNKSAHASFHNVEYSVYNPITRKTKEILNGIR